MKFAPILPPMKPSAPAASNCADGAQHTAYRVPEAMFKLRLLTRSINDDAENLLTLNKKIGQALIRFFSEMQSVQRMANAEFADEEYAETVARALESTIEKLDNNTYWSLLRTLTLMGKIDAVRAGLGAGETLPSDEICTQLYRKNARETHAFDAFVEENLLLVRMPMLPSIRAHGVINSGQKRAIFDTPMFVETVRGSVLSVKEKLPKIAKKCITYLFIYRDAAAPHLDSDNHNTKAITDEICSHFEAGDDGFYADFRFFMPAAVYVVPQGGLSWGTSVVNKERALFDDFVLRGMHTAKDMGHDCILLARKPRDLSRTLAMEPGKVAPRGMRYVVPMSREGMRDLEYIQNWGYHKLKAACSESISEAGYAKNTEKGTIPGNAATRISTVCPLIDPVTGNYITIGPLITIHVLKENAALMQVGKPVTVFCFSHQMAFYRAALGEEIDFLLASAEGEG